MAGSRSGICNLAHQFEWNIGSREKRNVQIILRFEAYVQIEVAEKRHRH
jgi:hypothetical protein